MWRGVFRTRRGRAVATTAVEGTLAESFNAASNSSNAVANASSEAVSSADVSTVARTLSSDGLSVLFCSASRSANTIFWKPKSSSTFNRPMAKSWIFFIV